MLNVHSIRDHSQQALARGSAPVRPPTAPDVAPSQRVGPLERWVAAQAPNRELGLSVGYVGLARGYALAPAQGRPPPLPPYL